MNFVWKQYRYVDDFVNATREILMFDKFQNSIILKVLLTEKGKQVDENMRLVTVSKDNKIVLIGFQTLPHQMLYYIQGDEKSAKRFAELYAKRIGKQFKNRKKLNRLSFGAIGRA